MAINMKVAIIIRVLSPPLPQEVQQPSRCVAHSLLNGEKMTRLWYRAYDPKQSTRHAKHVVDQVESCEHKTELRQHRLDPGEPLHHSRSGHIGHLQLLASYSMVIGYCSHQQGLPGPCSPQQLGAGRDRKSSYWRKGKCQATGPRLRTQQLWEARNLLVISTGVLLACSARKTARGTKQNERHGVKDQLMTLAVGLWVQHE